MERIILSHTERDGTVVYHYIAPGKPGPGYPEGVPTGYVKRVKDGVVVEDRKQTFDDIAKF